MDFIVVDHYEYLKLNISYFIYTAFGMLSQRNFSNFFFLLFHFPHVLALMETADLQCFIPVGFDWPQIEISSQSIFIMKRLVFMQKGAIKVASGWVLESFSLCICLMKGCVFCQANMPQC